MIIPWVYMKYSEVFGARGDVKEKRPLRRVRVVYTEKQNVRHLDTHLHGIFGEDSAKGGSERESV